jgi:hypothetical protein
MWYLCLMAFKLANYWKHNDYYWGHTRRNSFMGMLNMSCAISFTLASLVSQPYFGRVRGWFPHSQNGDLGVRRDSRNFKVRLQGSIKPRIEAFFISLERYQSVDVENGLAWPSRHLQHKLWRKKNRKSNWQFDSRPLKAGNRPNLGVCR